MMPATMDELLLARAKAMADHDGVAVDVAYIQGAASQLQVELITARDQMVVATLGSAPGSAHAPAPAPAEAPAEQVDETEQ